MAIAADARPAEPQIQASDQAADEVGTQDRLAKLQVSAYFLTLDSGVFCVFPTPDSPRSDPVSGLPGVRIEVDPGSAGRPEAVSISTFRGNGWLDGTAALVRVINGSARILVTIYQGTSHLQDAAPRLQVLRLSKEPDTPTAKLDAAANVFPLLPKAQANPEIIAHIQRTGDIVGNIGKWTGSKGSGLWIEGFGLALNGALTPEDIEYQAVLGRDWLSPWIEGGKFCGSRGMALPLLGFKLRLKGSAAEAFECSYSATFVDGGAVGPIGAGEACQAKNLAALEAFLIVIRPRSGTVNPKSNGQGRSVVAGSRETAAKPRSGRPGRG
jgi:hypothetical protein